MRSRPSRYDTGYAYRRRRPQHGKFKRIDPGRRSLVDGQDADRVRALLSKVARTAEARLRYYASQFPIVEVDSSYYALPPTATSQLWVERTPQGFVMNVKAFRLFTGHQTTPAVLPKDLQQALAPRKGNLFYKVTPAELRDELWRRFHEALAPLRHAGRLGLVHFQFPPWLLRNREGREHVQHCVERMQGFTVSVEFRNRTWFDDAHRDQTVAFEHELAVVHTVVDGPRGSPTACRPSGRPRIRALRWCGCMAATRPHGTCVGRRPHRNGSTTTTRMPSWPAWRRRSAE